MSTRSKRTRINRSDEKKNKGRSGKNKEDSRKDDKGGNKKDDKGGNKKNDKGGHKKEEQSFRNLTGIIVNVKSDEWYNLATNRIVRKLKNRTFLISPRVVGSSDQLSQFMIMNNLTLDSIIIPDSSYDLFDDLTTIFNVDATSNKGSVTASSEGSVAASSEEVTEVDMNDLIKRYPQMELKETIISLSRNAVVVAAKKWYNLETSRSIGNLKNKEFFISPRVAGSLELLIEFLLINEIKIDEVIIPESRPHMRRSIKAAIAKRRSRIINTTDIDQVSQEEIDILQPFNFNRITVKARLTRVIDGDTFDCVTIIDPHILALPTAVRVDNRTVIGQTVTICSNSVIKSSKDRSGMLVKLRIRLDGADAADCLTRSDKATDLERERMKLKKEAATDFVRRWALLSDNRVWLQLLGYDCRSRLLGQLYSRSLNEREFDSFTSSNSLTKQLLTYRDSKYGTVALPYDGSTNRTEAWKALLN